MIENLKKNLGDRELSWSNIISDTKVLTSALDEVEKLESEVNGGKNAGLAMEFLLALFLRDDEPFASNKRLSSLYDNSIFCDRYHKLLIDQLEKYPSHSDYIKNQHFMDLNGSMIIHEKCLESKTVENNWKRVCESPLKDYPKNYFE